MEKELSNAIVFTTLVLLVLVMIIIFFVLFYRNRRRQFIREQGIITESMHKELLQARVEVQEQTLQHFCRELHDNIGQKLSVARIYINKLESAKTDSHEKEELSSISQILGDTINDLRSAANTLNPDAINRLGFIGSLQQELDRMNKTGLITCAMELKPARQERFSRQQELLLFRICQEFIQNSIKHGNCTHIQISIDFETNPSSLSLSDNGKGFDTATALNADKGSGLKNMINRTKLLGGQIDILSSPGAGTRVTILLPEKQTT